MTLVDLLLYGYKKFNDKKSIKQTQTKKYGHLMCTTKFLKYFQRFVGQVLQVYAFSDIPLHLLSLLPFLPILIYLLQA